MSGLPMNQSEAGGSASWHALRLDPAWMVAKLTTAGADRLLADYADAGLDPDLSLIFYALQLSLPVLQADPSQLAGQLRGRLLASQRPAIQALLAAIRPPGAGLWLRPLAPSLIPPNPPAQFTLRGHANYV